VAVWPSGKALVSINVIARHPTESGTIFYRYCEDKGERLSVKKVTGKEQRQDNGQLVDEMPEDVFEHGSGDECHVAAVRPAVQ